MKNFINQIPLLWFKELPYLSWKWLNLGLKNEWLSIDIIKPLGEMIAEKGKSSENSLFDFYDAISSHDIHQISEVIEKLAEEDKIADEVIAQQWGYILLKWIYQNKDGIENPFELVTYIYESLGYPENMEGFIPYMPFLDNQPPLEMNETYNDRMVKNLKTYLENWLKDNPTARPGDRAAAENVLQDMQQAFQMSKK